MPEINANQSIGDIVAVFPPAARVFGRRRIDYCCGGTVTLADACHRAGIDAEQLMAEISAEQRGGEAAGDWSNASLNALIDHVLHTHHAYTRTVLEELHPLLDKVVRVHGGSHPELNELARLYATLRSDLQLHLMKEENVLFPYIRALEDGHFAPVAHFGSVANPIRMMTMEHETDGAILRRMLEVSDDFTPPPGACASYTALYAGLQELVDDLMRHIHLENHILFPGAIARERRAREGQAT